MHPTWLSHQNIFAIHAYHGINDHSGIVLAEYMRAASVGEVRFIAGMVMDKPNSPCGFKFWKRME